MRTIIAATLFTFILASIGSPVAAQSPQPTLLFLVEGRGVSTGTIHVFNLNTSTGFVTQVPGSPFNAGLIPQQLVVDPTGRFVYVTNAQSEDITAFSVDPATGALTESPGSPYLIGAAPVTSAVDPTGRFLYVFANNAANAREYLYQYTIDNGTGVLTNASSSPTPWEFAQGYAIVSIAFNPVGNFAYLAQVAAGNVGAPTLVCSVDFSSGIITPVGSVQPATTGEAAKITVSPNGNFLYSINTMFSQADVFSVGSRGGSLAEISGSPYSVPYGPSSLAVHPSGSFLYLTNSNSTFQAPPSNGPVNGSIYAFSVDSMTGALAQVAGSPYATGIDPLSVVVDPTGGFAYWTTTSNPSGKPFAQIMGYAINPGTGALTPLSWTPWTDTVTSNGAQLAISTGPPPAPNPVPQISSLSPPSSVATDVAFTLQVNGINFVPGATVYFGGQPRNTTFVSSTELNANILASDIDNDGIAVVFVFNPLPGGGASTSVEFPLSAPSPVVSSLAPSNVTAGGPLFGLAVFGANFVASSVVKFNGAPRATSLSSPTVLSAVITAADIAAPGTASISVTTPSNGVPGGGTSGTVALTIGPPTVPFAVASISPTSATAGGPAFLLTVVGTGFVQNSQITFNLLSNFKTTLVSPTELTALIPASDIAIAGNPYVIVNNPDGSASVPITFVINPSLGSVSPPSLPAGSNALTLSVTGTGFVPAAVVLVNGNPRVTVYKSSTLLEVTLLPADLSQGGTLIITVMIPGSSSVTTSPVTVNVTDYSVTPPSSTVPVTAGQTANLVLTISPMNGAFGDPVTLGVSPSTPLPVGASASFTPSAPVTPGATPQTVGLSISTTPHMVASTHQFPLRFPPMFSISRLAGVVVSLASLCIWASRRRVRLLAPRLLLVIVVALLAGLAACGAVGPGTFSPPQLNPATGTPAGSYTITVTANSGGVLRSATVTLTVM